eukprot:gnl/TRDRNA2_/TRDRNA2_36542_c0_seq1.p1 gnl/TRDRNA2_/TRDRNA2_36542_c0~~gnl/TRDRNA2_/TRDRNA2_36542_c0_seq1.p1  ORF type:complete len:847 (-),score=225.88 gnl/TRDRNA2_/TRDRNA2_36542_c0_seq1:88-2442(-)
MVAATRGKVQSLYTILDQVRRMRDARDRAECLDARDEENRTALMMAAVAGHLECVEMLKSAGARLDLQDDDGHTARSRAVWSGKQDVVDLLDGILKESSDEPDSAAESEGGFEGETSTQRRKRKKREKTAGGGTGLSCAARRAVAASQPGKDCQQKEGDGEANADEAEPVLKEICEALAAAAKEKRESGTVKELTIRLSRTEESQIAGLAPGAMDPALWRCGLGVRHLEIRWRPGLGAGSLDRVGALTRLLSLIVQDSGLASLPESLCHLKELRSLDVDGNALETFPKSLGQLSGSLESLSAARNKLRSEALARLSTLEQLLALKLDHNLLEDLDDLELSKKPRLVHFSVAHNRLAELPDDVWGHLVMLQHLNLSANKLQELPCEMGAMKEKKLTELLLHENPWKDGKIRNMIESSAALSNTVLVYLRKQKPKGRKGGAKKKGKAAKSDSPSESEGEDPTAAESDREAAVVDTPAPKKKGKKAKAKAKAKDEKAAEEVQVDEEDEEARRARLAAEEEAKRRETEERRLEAAAKKAQKAELEERLNEKKLAAQAAAQEREKEKERKDTRKAAAAKQREQEEALEQERKANMSPEERQAEEDRARAEKERQERHAAMVQEESRQMAERQAQLNEQKIQERERCLKDDETKFKFVFYGGSMHKVRIDGASSNAKGGKRHGGGGVQPGQPVQPVDDDGKGKGANAGGKGGYTSMHFEGSIEVPKDLIGRLIGKGGATIKELCQSTGAVVNIPKETKAGATAVMVEIRGGKKAVDAAVQRISELLAAAH